MPQNTPMKRQFTTIDGRTVMSNLPQHWGGNDWTITGVDNPLPVGNYVQTESGVWIPQKGSDDGAADVRLAGNRVEEIYHEPSSLTLEPSESIRIVNRANIRSNKIVITMRLNEWNNNLEVWTGHSIYPSGSFFLYRSIDTVSPSGLVRGYMDENITGVITVDIVNKADIATSLDYISVIGVNW